MDDVARALQDLRSRWTASTAALRRELLTRQAYDPDLVEHLMSGLAKAGLEDKSVLSQVSLAVPLIDVAGNSSQAYLSEGLTAEIVGELSRYSELAVMPCRSGPCATGSIDVRRIGREIGAHYVLRGSLQSSPERIRLNMQLLDGRDGRSIWADAFESTLRARELFDLQDELADQVVGAIAGSFGALTRAELPGARRKPPASLESRDCVFRAYDYLQHHNHNRATHRAARDCLESVARAEPDYVEGLAWLAYFYVEQFHHRWNDDGAYDPRERAIRAAERAVALDDTNQLAHAYLGVAALFSGDDARGIAEIQRGVELNPNNPAVLTVGAWYLGFQGEFESATRLAERAKRLIPNPPQFVNVPLFLECYTGGRYEQALQYTKKSLIGPGQFLEPLLRAATLGQLGRADAAVPVLAELREMWGEVCRIAGCKGLDFATLRREMTERWTIAEPIADRLLEGLRRAGLDESGPTDL